MKERMRMLWFRVRNWALRQSGMEHYRASYWKRKFEQCEREKHAKHAINIGGKPGVMCLKCGYQREIARQQFKRMFGKSFNQARAEISAKRAAASR